MEAHRSCVVAARRARKKIARAGAPRQELPGKARVRSPRSPSPRGQGALAPSTDVAGDLVDGALERFGAARAGASTGPRAAVSDLQAALRSERERQEWVDSVWNAAVLGNNLSTRASIKAGLRCWFAFSCTVLRVPADRALPPSVRGLVSWSLAFKCAGTFANYVSHVKVGCLLANVPIGVFDHPVVKRAKTAVASRGLHVSRPRHFVRHALLENLVRASSSDEAAVQWRYLWVVAYAFLLRVPSEAIPLRAGDPGVPAAWHAGLFIQGDEMRLRLRARKNRRQGSLLSRRCWCNESSATCPVHALGPWLARHRRGAPLFPLVTPAAALSELRRALRVLAVPDAAQYRTHDFRRGHAEAPPTRPSLCRALGLPAALRRTCAHLVTPWLKFSKQENGGGALCGAPIGQAAASLGAPGRLRFWRTSTFSPWNGTRSCRPTLPSLLATKVNSHRAVSPHFAVVRRWVI